MCTLPVSAMQYPDWLSSHHGKISEEDYQRYTKQFEVMTSICREFDNPAEEEGSPSSQASSEKILHLMQQLQQYGQPPEDMAGENVRSIRVKVKGGKSMWLYLSMQTGRVSGLIGTFNTFGTNECLNHRYLYISLWVDYPPFWGPVKSVHGCMRPHQWFHFIL